MKTSSLGDVIHMMPAITDARRACPDAHISWLIDETYVPLARLHPAIDEIIPVAWRRWRRNLRSRETWTEMQAFSRHLRQRRYDAVIDTQGLIHSASMARLADGHSTATTPAAFAKSWRHHSTTRATPSADASPPSSATGS